MEKKESNKNYFNYFLDVVSNFVISIIQKINKLLTSKKKGGLVKAIIRVVCCLFLLSLLEIPFLLVGKTIHGILYLCDLPFNSLILEGWIFTYELAYTVISLIILMKTILDMSKKNEFSFEIKGSKEKGKELYNTVYTVLRVITIISLIPLVLLWVLLFAVLGMLVWFLTHGIYFLGPILMVIGILIIVCYLLSYLYDVIFENKGVNK